MVMLRNYMEILVEDALDKVLKSYPDCCRCKVCRMDIQAIALNNLKPMYYVTTEGEAYNKVNLLEAQFKLTILQEIIRGVEIVKKNPRQEHLEYSKQE